MAITDMKITAGDYTGKQLTDAPDRPTGSAQDVKALFDAPVKGVVQPKLNALIDLLAGASGAGSIGAAQIPGVSGTTVQTLLVGLKALYDACYTAGQMDALLADKATNTRVAKLIRNVEIDPATGVFTFTRDDGTSYQIDTALEKITTNWSYDEATESLVLMLADGTTQRISLSAFISENEFVESDMIAWSVVNHKVTATIKTGSITDTMLSSALITAIQGYVTQCGEYAGQAAASAENARLYAEAVSGYLSSVQTQAGNAAASAQTAQEAARAAQNATEHPPRVGANGNWEIYQNGKYVDSGAPARGERGNNFRVLDYYDTLELLRAEVSAPEDGDAYGVGVAAPYDIYIYSPSKGWVNNGTIQGPSGEKGEQGDTGASGVYIGSEEPDDQMINVWIDDGGDSDLSRTMIIPRGRYHAETVYRRGDVVTYAYSSWLVLRDNIRGMIPAEGEYYMLMAGGEVVFVTEITGAEVVLELQNNVEYRCTDAVTSLTIDGFAAGEQGRAELWAIQFTAGDTITVSVPNSIVWAVAEPVFTAGSAYWLTFTPFGSNKYLGIWAEVEADEQTDV